MKMLWIRSLLFLLLCPLFLVAQPQHDRAFWRAIAQHKYVVPEQESADALSQEVSGLLASPDPELRDDLAYSILTEWIAQPNTLSPTQMLDLADEWRANLKAGIGETNTDSVLKRSFSALCLVSLAERDAKKPFLGETRYHQLLADTVAYLQTERDLRGYDAVLGWIHATAHTADLLQALAGNSLLNRDEEASILAAIAARISTAPQVYAQGEQDRLARAVLAVIRRPDFDANSFDAWVTRMKDEDRKVWANPLTPESLAMYQNHTYMLQALAVHLDLEAESPRIADFRQKVLAMLRHR